MLRNNTDVLLTYHFLFDRNHIRSSETLIATIDYGRTETRYIDFDTLLANVERPIELSVSNAIKIRMMVSSIIAREHSRTN